MTKDEICGLLRQIHDVLAMQSETNHWAKPTPAEYAMGYAEGFNDACKPKQGEPVPFKIYKPTPPRHATPNVQDAELPWVYDQDPSSGNVASMWVTPVQALRSKT
jgi:hypothetical protein